MGDVEYPRAVDKGLKLSRAQGRWRINESTKGPLNHHSASVTTLRQLEHPND